MPIFYTSQYPPEQSSTYVKATTFYTKGWPFFATDPTKRLTGSYDNNCWLSGYWDVTNQRFHIDLGEAKIIRRIYYENNHYSGSFTDQGSKIFTFWGSNIGPGTFDDLVYVHDEGWIELTVSQNIFDRHVSADQADPKYITVNNSVLYRYYAFKFANGWGSPDRMGFRRVELQTEDGYIPPPPPPKEASRTGIYTFKTLKI